MSMAPNTYSLKIPCKPVGSWSRLPRSGSHEPRLGKMEGRVQREEARRLGARLPREEPY